MLLQAWHDAAISNVTFDLEFVSEVEHAREGAHVSRLLLAPPRVLRCLLPPPLGQVFPASCSHPDLCHPPSPAGAQAQVGMPTASQVGQSGRPPPPAGCTTLDQVDRSHLSWVSLSPTPGHRPLGGSLTHVSWLCSHENGRSSRPQVCPWPEHSTSVPQLGAWTHSSPVAEPVWGHPVSRWAVPSWELPLSRLCAWGPLLLLPSLSLSVPLSAGPGHPQDSRSAGSPSVLHRQGKRSGVCI